MQFVVLRDVDMSDNNMYRNLLIGYIAGIGHSGSTLTDLLLGTQPTVASFGELKNLDDVRLGRLADGRCTCGAKLADCILWQPVLAALQKMGHSAAAVGLDHSDFDRANSLIFRELRRLSGCSILIDSSKSTKRLKRLIALPDDDIEVRIIHVVRDGRAVAYSNTRKGRVFSDWMKRWKDSNREIEKIASSGTPCLRVRYEDLVANPNGTLHAIMEFLDAAPNYGINLDWAGRLRHNIGGNRMRVGESSTIVADTEYLTALPDNDWADAWRIAGGMLEKYGYNRDREEVENN